MNEQLSEQVFDSLLAEALGGQSPPDLSARIEAAWMREKAGELPAFNKPLVRAEVVESVGDLTDRAVRLSKGVLPAQNPQDNSIEQTDRVRVQRAQEPMISYRRRLIAGVMGIAAAGILAMLSVQTFLNSDSNGIQAVNERSTEVEGGGRIADAVADRNATPRLADSSHDTAREQRSGSENPPIGEKLNLQDLPFSNDNVVASSAKDQIWKPTTSSLEPLSSEAIVAELDRRLGVIWDQVGVIPTQDLPLELVAARMHSVLTGAPLRNSSAVNASASSSFELADGLVKTNGFASFWAQLQTRNWLKRSGLPVDGKEAAFMASSLERSLADGQPWGQIAAELIGGKLDTKDSRSTSSVFITALAGGGNHRLAKRIGSNFLNENLECIRCHDQRSDVGESELQSQHVYWSLLALLNGIDAEGNGFQGERKLSDRQREMFSDANAPTIFYELPNGQLVSAEAQLPDGIGWRSVEKASPRAALAKWIAQSEELDRAAVNQSWKLIFGRFLAPQVESLEQVADRSRLELLNFLASQFRAHGQDMRQLASWIVSSKAFSRSPVQMTQTALLHLNEDELQQIKLADLVFANGTVASELQQSGSLEKSIASVLEPSGPGIQADGREMLLSQPSFDKIGGEERMANGQAARPLSSTSLSFALHGDLNTLAETDFVGRLLKSERLSWEQRVDHIVALSQHSVANDRVQQLAKELLQQNQGNAERALLDLLWAVKHSDES